MKTYSVILVDDHEIVRDGIRARLEKERDIEVIAETGDGEAALKAVETHKPDVLVLDISLDGSSLSGVDVTREIKKRELPVSILVLSAHKSANFILKVLEAGASGYLLKSELSSRIVEGVRGVARGEEWWFSKEVTALITRKQRSKSKGLSKREEEVLRRLTEGLSNHQIALNLKISDNTVKNHISNVFDKIGVNSRGAAINWAYAHGYASEC